MIGPDWNCAECGWVHPPDAHCACAPDANCECCSLVTVRERCEDAPCCGCCDAGSALMPG
jgi:hypothetical protein